MTWKNINYDWNQLKYFLVASEEGSLSGAARALGTTQPTLSRQIAALEEAMGVVLFERGERGLKLTDNGLSLIDHVANMAGFAEKFATRAAGAQEEIEGVVSISAGDLTTAYLVPLMLKHVREREPGIRIELVATNRYSDLKRREADIALRHTEPNQSGLISKQVRYEEFYLYAADSYLDKLGNPDSIEGFNDADFVAFDETDTLRNVLRGQGLKLYNKNFPYISENHTVHWEIVRQGLGIAPMPFCMGDNEPGVSRILPDLTPMMFPLWVVVHKDLMLSKRVKFVFDTLVEKLAEI
ncbi:MAG: LysR family transcriptional regulator [Alphaproteobacteria bacterium]|nr:LysR family transcriptional regulator [Alphaproteobacteria bacterium]